MKKRCHILIYEFFAGLIYIVGGCTHNSRHRQDVMSYNPVTREWNYLAPMLTPRSQMGITILDGYMYVVGGTSKNQEVLTSVERYSFEKVNFLFSNLFSLSSIFSLVLILRCFRTNGAPSPPWVWADLIRLSRRQTAGSMS